MNAIFSFLLLCSLQVFAYNTYGQKVSLHFKDASIKEVLTRLQAQTGINFFYNNSTIESTTKITYNVDSIEIKDALKFIEKGQNIKFIFVGKSITIRKLPEPINSDTLYPNIRNIESYSQRGLILGSDDIPLQDVTIQIERTGRGAISNYNGEFIIRDVRIGDILTFSYIGYSIQRVEIKELKFLEVKMNVAVSELDKVIIRGYGRTTKRYNTGNIWTVSAEEIRRQPVSNPLQALQGKVPGLIITQKNGYASSQIQTEIRGRSNIDPNMVPEPLIVVDGIPQNGMSFQSENNDVGSSSGLLQNGFTGPAGGQSPLYSLNISDIESITVLKDADATAIYGSRGGNGVIIITTKKGAPGKAKLEIDINDGFSFVPRFYDMLNTKEYIEMRKEAFRNDNILPTANEAYDISGKWWDTTRYTNWQEVFWGKNAEAFEGNINMAGGDKQTTFRISGAYKQLKSLNSFTGADRKFSSQFNLSHRSLNGRWNINFTNFYSSAKSDMIALGGSVLLPPNAPSIFDKNGNLNYAGWAPAQESFNFGYILSPYTAKTIYVNTNANIQYTILPGLRVSTSIGFGNSRVSQKAVYPIASKNPVTNPKGSAQFGVNNLFRLIIEPQLEYWTALGKGELNAIVGATYQSVNQDGNYIVGNGYVNDNLLGSISNAPVKDATDASGEYRYNGGFGRLNYNLLKRYLFNLSVRRDGSSRFGKGKQFGNFYSIGLGYILSEEKYFKKALPFISFAKIRGSYGTTGSDYIRDYGFLTRWSSTGVPTYQGGTVYVPLQHANPDLGWQVDKKLELGFNLGLFKDRLNFEISWYRNKINRQLLQFLLPSATGFDQVSANFPAVVQNSGIEPSVSYKLIKQRNVDWNFYANAGFNKKHTTFLSWH